MSDNQIVAKGPERKARGRGKTVTDGEAVVVDNLGINKFTDKVVEKLDKASIEDAEDVVVEQPLAVEYENVIEKLCDVILKANKASKEPSTGIPQLVMIIECPEHSDKATGNFETGCFKFSGDKIARMSVKDVKAWIDDKGKEIGSGQSQSWKLKFAIFV